MKHDHHTAPRYYLSAFSIPDEPALIWEYKRGIAYNPGQPGKGRNPVKRALRKASVKQNYYGPYEDRLMEREEEAKPVLEQLRTQKATTALTPAEKQTLTDYIGLFMKRTTAREEGLPAIWNTTRAKGLIEIERAITILMNEGRFKKALELQDEKKKYEQDLPEDIRQRSTIEPYNLVRRRIMELWWTFLTALSPTFITSDNPVRYPEQEGLGHERAFLAFPISPTTILFAVATPAAEFFTLPIANTDCGVAQVNDEHGAVLNHLTITGAHNYLFSHHANEELAKSFG